MLEGKNKGKGRNISSVRLNFYLFYASVSLLCLAFSLYDYSRDSKLDQTIFLYFAICMCFMFASLINNYISKDCRVTYDNHIKILLLIFCLLALALLSLYLGEYFISLFEIDEIALVFPSILMISTVARSGSLFGKLNTIKSYEEIENGRIKEEKIKEEKIKEEKIKEEMIKQLPKNMLEDLFPEDDNKQNKVIHYLFEKVAYNFENLLIQHVEFRQHVKGERGFSLLYLAIEKALKSNKIVDKNRVLKCFAIIASNKLQAISDKHELNLIYNFFRLHFTPQLRTEEENKEWTWTNEKISTLRMNQVICKYYSIDEKSYLFIYTYTLKKKIKLPKTIVNLIMMHMINQTVFEHELKDRNYIDDHTEEYLTLAGKYPKVAISSLQYHYGDIDKKNHKGIWDKLVDTVCKDENLKVIFKNTWGIIHVFHSLKQLDEFVNQRKKYSATSLLYFFEVQDLIKVCTGLNVELVKAINHFKQGFIFANVVRCSNTPLSSICAQKHSTQQIEIAKILLENGADVNGLRYSVLVNSIEELSEKGYISNLELAIKKKNIELVKLLYEKGADVNMHFLAYSCMHGDLKIVEYLLPICQKDAGFDINKAPSYPSSINYAPLTCCVFNDDQQAQDKMKQYLIKMGAKGNELINCYFDPKNIQQKDMIKKLIENNVYNENIVTFFKVINALNVRLITAMLNSNSNFVKMKYKDDGTAMSLICRKEYSKKQIEIAEILLENGANVNGIQLGFLTNSKKVLNSARYISNLELAIKNKNIELVKLLCQKGADVNMHFLAYSCMHGDLEIVKYLLSICQKDAGFDINKTPSYPSYITFTPLIYCLYNNEKERYNIMDLLITNNADINAKVLNDVNALHIAVTKLDTKAVKILLQNGAEVNSSASFLSTYIQIEETPLHRAIVKHKTKEGMDIIKLLIEHGADPKFKNSNGESCLDIVKNIPCQFQALLLKILSPNTEAGKY